MSKKILWDQFSTRTLMLFTVLCSCGSWGWRISEGKLTTQDTLTIIFTTLLIFELYSTCKKLYAANTALTEELANLRASKID